jgi:IclR family acetate operon transcriptional repressor
MRGAAYRQVKPRDVGRPPHPAGAKTQIQSASRAVRLLLLIAERPDGATATESATALGVPVPTAYHLLNTLVAEGVLAKDPRRRYVLGPRVGLIADAVSRDLIAPSFLAGPLEDLAASTGETAYLTAWRRGEITVLDCVEGAHAVKVSGLYRGYCEHAHARSTGKLLLAWASVDVREDYLSKHPLLPLTERTIVDRAHFDHELERIRRHGFATDTEEFAEGVACVAVPVVEGASLIAAYTVAAPRERFDRRRDELTQAALGAARSVAARARAGGSEHEPPSSPPVTGPAAGRERTSRRKRAGVGR